MPQHDKQWGLRSAVLLKFNFIAIACHPDEGGIYLRYNQTLFFTKPETILQYHVNHSIFYVNNFFR